MKRYLQLMLPLLCVVALSACSSGEEKQESPSDDVVVSGDAFVSDNAKVMFQFSAWHDSREFPFTFLQKNGGDTQYICCDAEGSIINSFSVNREMLVRALTRLDSTVAINYSDFTLYCYSDKVEFVDDSLGLNASNSANRNWKQQGYIEDTDTAYFLQPCSNFTPPESILRFVSSSNSYDLRIPGTDIYVAYDRVRDRFLYHTLDDDESYEYGFLEYDSASGRYSVSGETDSIPLQSEEERYDLGSCTDALCEDNQVYEMFTVDVNEAVAQDLNLSSDYLESADSGRAWSVLMLRTFDLDEGTSKLEYLTEKPVEIDAGYPDMTGGQAQTPVTAVNGNLYYFTNGNDMMNVYNPQTGFAQYHLKFDNTGTFNPHALFDAETKGSTTLEDGSPIRIYDDGSFYVAHAYRNGSIKIHKYNYEKQKFEPYWSSKPDLIYQLNEKSMVFSSFEILK